MFTQPRLAATAAIMLILVACNGGPADQFVNPNCGEDVEMTFEDWSSWTRVTSTTLFSEGHPRSYVDVYVDDLAKDTYLTASAPYQECARIVKVRYTDETASEVKRLAIMVKMPAGYDPEYNDWWYARYNPTGTEVISQGRMASECRYCHLRAENTDYLFSEEVLAASSD